jgi:hypothetical protein
MVLDARGRPSSGCGGGGRTSTDELWLRCELCRLRPRSRPLTRIPAPPILPAGMMVWVYRSPVAPPLGGGRFERSGSPSSESSASGDGSGGGESSARLSSGHRSMSPSPMAFT